MTAIILNHDGSFKGNGGDDERLAKKQVGPSQVVIGNNAQTITGNTPIP